MNLPPQAPTDNLYKFLAIFGLALVIMSFSGTMLLVKSTNTSANDVLVKMRLFEADKDYIERATGSLERTTDTLLEIYSDPKAKYDKEYARKNIEAVKEKLDALNKSRVDIDKQWATIDGSGQNLKFEFQFMLSMFKVTGIFGIICCLYGFINWYLKLQRYQDEIVRNDAEKSKKVTKKRQ